jgi:hypothetical protein
MTEPITDPAELEALDPDEKPERPIGYTKVYSDGWTIISTTTGYTESHLIHIIAYDAAGNETETEKFRLYIVHEEEEEEEEEAADDSQAFVLPSIFDRVRYREGPHEYHPSG